MRVNSLIAQRHLSDTRVLPSRRVLGRHGRAIRTRLRYRGSDRSYVGRDKSVNCSLTSQAVHTMTRPIMRLSVLFNMRAVWSNLKISMDWPLEVFHAVRPLTLIPPSCRRFLRSCRCVPSQVWSLPALLCVPQYTRLIRVYLLRCDEMRWRLTLWLDS